MKRGEERREDREGRSSKLCLKVLHLKQKDQLCNTANGYNLFSKNSLLLHSQSSIYRTWKVLDVESLTIISTPIFHLSSFLVPFILIFLSKGFPVFFIIQF